jgi:thiamine kinase-like enzyme
MLPERALAALASLKVPRLTAEGLAVTRLGGLSNSNFKVETGEGTFVVRLLERDPAGVVDRRAEVEAMRLAEEIGIGAELVHADLEAGVMITRFVSGARALSAERLDAAAIDRAGGVLGRLHRSGRALSRRFDMFATLSDYAQLLRAKGGVLPWSPRLDGVIAQARAAFGAGEQQWVPSHGDPVPENFLDLPDRMLLIDWEYAAMADPAWDLAYLSLEAGFDPAREAMLVAASGEPSIAPDRLAAFKLVAATLGNLWGLLRGLERRSPDLGAWTGKRLADAEALAADPGLPRWLESLRA